MRLAVIFIADLQRVRTLAIYSCRLHASPVGADVRQRGTGGTGSAETTSTFLCWRHVGRRWPVRVN